MQKRIPRIRAIIAVSVLLLFSGVPTGLASPPEKDETSAAEVKSEAAETYQTLKQYTLQQRDQAVAVAENKLAKLDAQIAELQNKLDQQWQDMSNAARENTRAAMNALQQQRKDVAEWYGGMRHSSAYAWEEVKKGFADSYDQLKSSFSKARKDFEKD